MKNKVYSKEIKKEIIDNNISKNSLTIHYDQGIHFSCNAYISILKTYNLIESHSRSGNCLDNSPIESFFSLFKKRSTLVGKTKKL